MTIGIHVLGPGYGESIVVELPDGQLGVIDSFRTPIGPVLLPELLRRRFNASALLFLAVTHPHADHCVGVEQLLGDFPCAELWVFDAIQQQTLCDYYRELMHRALRDPVEEDLDLKFGTTLRELECLRENILARWAASPRQTFRLLRSQANFTLCGGAVRVRGLTPGDGSLVGYRERLNEILATILARVVAAHPHSRGLWRRIVRLFQSIPGVRAAASAVPSVNQNLASSALLLEHGDTRLLFMADAERPLWEDWDKERASCAALAVKGIHFLKVAHHGSLNGYLDALYLAACAAATPVAVVTPFNRSRSPLPSDVGLQRINTFVPEVLCTNRLAAEISSGRRWAPPAGGGALLPGLPSAWIRDIKRERRLVKLLAPPYGDPARVPRHFGVPRRWLHDLKVRPELHELLHPILRGLPLPSPPATPHNEHIVSIYFDDKGREVRRQLGRNTGTLV
jgi:hypothetical protein